MGGKRPPKAGSIIQINNEITEGGLKMKSIAKEEHKKISAGLSTQQLLKKLKEQGYEISKRHLFRIRDEREMVKRELVWVAKIATPRGFQNSYIWSKEGTHEILMSVKKIYPEEKKQYLIEATKPQLPSLAEIKQIGLALAGISDTLEYQQKQIEDLQNQQNDCRVSAEKDNNLLRLQREIVEHRLHKKKLSWNDRSARQIEYGYLRSYLDKEIGISRVTNLNGKEHHIVRDKLLEIMDWEKIPY